MPLVNVTSGEAAEMTAPPSSLSPAEPYFDAWNARGGVVGLACARAPRTIKAGVESES
jgi:hypothetical protein